MGIFALVLLSQRVVQLLTSAAAGVEKCFWLYIIYYIVIIIY